MTTDPTIRMTDSEAGVYEAVCAAGCADGTVFYAHLLFPSARASHAAGRQTLRAMAERGLITPVGTPDWPPREAYAVNPLGAAAYRAWTEGQG